MFHRNHAWVSFQGFGESFNDAFSVPKELGEEHECMTLCEDYNNIYRVSSKIQHKNNYMLEPCPILEANIQHSTYV